MASTVKETSSLTSYYSHLYQNKYNAKPVMNGYKARWGFDTMLGHLSSKDIQELLEYYFNTISLNGHTLEWFFYNYESLMDGLVAQRREQEKQAQVLSETEKRVMEWRKRIENSGTSD